MFTLVLRYDRAIFTVPQSIALLVVAATAMGLSIFPHAVGSSASLKFNFSSPTYHGSPLQVFTWLGLITQVLVLCLRIAHGRCIQF